MNTFYRLFKKDAHSLLALIYGLLSLELLTLIEEFFTKSPDNFSWLEYSLFLEVEGGITSYLFIVIGLIAGYQVFSHERSQATLTLLWSLPISRRKIYLTKLFTAASVISAYGIFSSLLTLWLHSFSASSILQDQFSFSFWAWESSLFLLLQIIGVGFGALISYYRMTGVLVFVGISIVWSVIATLKPELRLNLLAPEFFGSDFYLNKTGWAVCISAGLFSAILGGLLWTKNVEVNTYVPKGSWRNSRLLSIVLYSFSFIVVIIFSATTLFPDVFLEGEAENSQTLQSINTANFVIFHYAQDQEPAHLLSTEAEPLLQEIKELLGASEIAKTQVDLTGESPNHLGIAGWKRLRINSSSLVNAEERHHVFVHELAHVIAAQQSDGMLDDHSNYTKFFNEGLAEWVSFELLGLEENRNALFIQAATSWQRLDMKVEDFLYWTEFSKYYDETLVYALGSVWLTALVDTCGKQAPGKVLNAMARPDAPQRLQGIQFWQDLLNNANCDLNIVNNRFNLMMDQLNTLESIVPFLTSAVTSNTKTIEFDLMLGDGSSPTYKVYIRARDNASVGPLGTYTETLIIEAGKSAHLSFSRLGLSGKTFQYQLGVEFIPGQRPYFSRWINDA